MSRHRDLLVYYASIGPSEVRSTCFIFFFWLPPNHQPSQPYIPPPDRVSTSLFDDFADIPATLLFSQGLQMDIEGRGAGL